MSSFRELDTEQRAEFISFRETLEKLMEATNSSLDQVARVLRAKKVHFKGGVRYRPGILVDGGYEEEPLGFLLERTGEDGSIPGCWDIRREWGPDNIGWRRADLITNLETVGLPTPKTLRTTSCDYAPRGPAIADTTFPSRDEREQDQRNARRRKEPSSADSPVAPMLVSTKRISEAFPPPRGTNPNNWCKTLGDPPKWLKGARGHDPGGRGKSALWSPAQLAVCMVLNGHIGKGQAGAIIRREFPEWVDKWEQSALLINK